MIRFEDRELDLFIQVLKTSVLVSARSDLKEFSESMYIEFSIYL